MKPITNSAYQLLHEGCIALAQVEYNGIKIDVEYLNKSIKRTSYQINKLSDNLKRDKIYKTWRKEKGSKTNLQSRAQLSDILFRVMKLKCLSHTPAGRPQANEESLKATGLSFVKDYLQIEKLKNARSTYLYGISREVVDGFLHPSFPLNFVRSYRGSSRNPNFTNIPVRDPEFAELIRTAFIARKNHRIIEIDFKGIEICSAACYHEDPRMISYIKNPKLDLHRDMAAQIYMLKKNQVTKDTRYCGKNKFVFPQFFGDWYLSCAQHLWEAISAMKLKTVDGLSLRKHLKREGIKRLGRCDPEQIPRKGTFEYHLKEIEDDFWNNRFKIYNQWKKDWYKRYLSKGYFDYLTGFRVEAFLNRKQVINYPVQGTAFHWLLWCLIQIQKQMNKYKMKSKIVGQIHDSIVGDIYKRERKDYLEIVKQVIYEDIRKHWPWIIVPLLVEVEMCPVNGNWYQKREIQI